MTGSLVVCALVLQAAAPAPEILPLRKLRLYETGVGYFERDGQVRGGDRATLPLPSSHLDDALKTLVVLSSGGSVEIRGIEFGSAVSEGMARAMAGLPLEADTEVSFVDLLRSLQGLEVEARTAGARVRGRLVEVLGPYAQDPAAAAELPASTLLASLHASERAAEGQGEGEARPPAPQLEPEFTLIVRGEGGVLQRLRTRDVIALRPTEAGAAARMEVALAALSNRAPQAPAPLVVQVRGDGPLRLGYVAETPVWRTTYRVLLDARGGATLQAWALVHNDSDEDWRGVKVELVNGRPTSFLFPLAAPRYARRELAAPEVELSTVPQLLTTTADRLWGDFVDGEASLGVHGIGSGGSGAGYGSGMGSLGVRGVGSGGEAGGGPVLGDLARFAQATGEEMRTQFVYRLATPLDLAAHHSALVPVVQGRVDAEAITWFGPGESEGRSGVRLKNSTAQTLPAGTLAVFGAGGFEGESGFERLKPGEQSFVVHGVDLDMDLARRKTGLGEACVAVRVVKDALQQQLVVDSAVDVDLRNRSALERVVYVVLPVERNATVEGHAALDYDHARAQPLARFVVAGGGQLQHRLRVQEVTRRATPIARLDGAALRALANAAALPKATREQLGQAAELRARRERSARQRAAQATRIDKLTVELTRLRADLQAMGSARLQDPSLRKLGERVLQREEELERLERSIEAAETDEAQLDAQIATALKAL